MNFLRNLLGTSCLLASFLLLSVGASAESLLKNHPLDGTVKTTYWTFLSSQNKFLISDVPATMTGTMTVASPGYGAGVGLYSWTGAYSMTVNQGSAAGVDIQHAVYQMDVTWDPAVSFPFNGGPVLSYNGGNQQIPATLPMIVDGLRVVDNNTGIPEMEGIDKFAYRGVTWQWDLSGISDVITSVKVHMPLANHTSVVGARVDVASDFGEIGGNTTTPLQLWRQVHFQTPNNSGRSADTFDADGDGIPNILEYALGANPTSAVGVDGHSALPQPTATGDRLKINFALPVSPPAGITYRVKASGDLKTWTTLATKVGSAAWVWNAGGTSRVTVSPSTERVYVEVADPVAKAGNPKRMMRLEITY